MDFNLPMLQQFSRKGPGNIEKDSSTLEGRSKEIKENKKVHPAPDPTADSESSKGTKPTPTHTPNKRGISMRSRLAAHSMAEIGDVELLQKLHRVYPEKLLAANKFGENAAHVAVRSGCLDVVRFLLRVVPSLFEMEDIKGILPSQRASTSRSGRVRNLNPFPESILWFF